jgi:hypothetical protein
MTIPYYPHSGRRKHYWKVRSDGMRDLLIKHHWRLKGGYCEKTINGRSVMQTIVKHGDDHCIVCLLDKDDFWADATARVRAAEAEQRRKAFKVVAGLDVPPLG